MKDEELLRYSRQILLPQIDLEGQDKLSEATVLVVGVGGLGSPVAMYLAASGIGHIVLCDADTVELSNLQRQVIHATADIGSAKVASARDHIESLNPHVKVTCLEQFFSAETADAALAGVDIVVDCTDHLDSRFAINKACVDAKKPLVSAAAIRWEGQLSVFDARDADSPCYHCFYGDVKGVPGSCSENGVVGPLLGVMGSLQALETVKLITGAGDSAVGTVLLFDAFYQDWTQVEIPKKQDCAVCGIPS